MTLLRSCVRTLMLLGLLLAAVADGWVRKRFFGLRAGSDGAVWVHHWCRRIVRTLGIACLINGDLPEGDGTPLAVVSNHLSYLDILLYSAARPFVMVAKSEVRDWPLIGWITAQAGTVYVERADVKGGRTQTHAEINAAMAKAFASGLPVLFFPEGTTSDGAAVLPFRRGLFHSVIAARAPVTTAALAFSLAGPDAHTSVANHVCFWGEMEFAPHLFRCLGVPGLRAHLSFSGRAIMSEDRFALARSTRDQVLDQHAFLSARKLAKAAGRQEQARRYAPQRATSDSA